MNNIILFQLESFHEELIPGFFQAIYDAGFNPLIYTNQRAFKTKGNIFNQSIHCDALEKNTLWHDGEDEEAMADHYFENIKAKSPKAVIFLTYYSKCAEKLARLCQQGGIKVLAVVHNVKKTMNIQSIRKSLAKRSIRPIFLSDHVQSDYFKRMKLNLKRDQGNSSVIYNIFTPSRSQPGNNNTQHTRITILGSINEKNFNYDHLLNFARANSKTLIDNHIEFSFAASGRYRKTIENNISNLELQELFKFNQVNEHNRVEYEDYYNTIRNSDFILCLKRAGIGLKSEDSRISSSIPSGISMNVPFICGMKVSHFYSIENCSISGINLKNQIQKLSRLIEANRLSKRIQLLRNNLRSLNQTMLDHNVRVMKNLLKE